MKSWTSPGVIRAATEVEFAPTETIDKVARRR